MAQEYISQVYDEVEGRVTKKLSKDISPIESRILGALSKLDDFVLDLQVRTCSVAVPGTSRMNNLQNPEHTGDRFLDNPCPTVVFSTYHSGPLKDPEQEETYHMLTGAGEEICNHDQMVTGVQQKIPNCSPGISSSKRKKARSTSQPHLCSENTPGLIEAEQILLAFQQLATSSTSAIFQNNINRNSKSLKSLKTTLPTFDGTLKKFELLEDLFQTSLKTHDQLTEKKD